ARRAPRNSRGFDRALRPGSFFRPRHGLAPGPAIAREEALARNPEFLAVAEKAALARLERVERPAQQKQPEIVDQRVETLGEVRALGHGDPAAAQEIGQAARILASLTAGECRLDHQRARGAELGPGFDCRGEPFERALESAPQD